jgi:serine protease Do
MSLFDKMRQQKLMSVTLMVFTLSVGILIGTLVNTQVNAARGQNAAPDATPLTVPKAVDTSNEFTKIAKKLQPSVVNVIVEVAAKPQTASRNHKGGSPDDEGDGALGPFGGLFGIGPNGPEVIPQQAQKHEQSGTGFVVDKNGYIVTNNHVVEGGDKVTVKMYGDPTEYRARIIGTDYETDLAILKIDAHRPLETVAVGNSDAVQVGDWAIAIGSPFTLEESVTLGIVSALGRGSDQVEGARSFQHFIQTDAAINPGNSGGPLVNIRGEVIGVNTMIATSRGGSEGVGFALPSNTIVRVYNDVIRDGEVSRGSIGVSFNQKQKPEMLRGLGVDHGVVITLIAKGGPSEKAGLKRDDIILAVNGQAIKEPDDLMARVADSPVGSALTLTVDRDGKKTDFKVVTEDRKKLYADNPTVVGENFVAPDVPKPEATAGVKLGIRPRELTDDERSKVPEKRGVYVSSVEADSFASDIDLREGLIITAINRKPVGSVEDVRKIMGTLKSGDAVAINVVHLPDAGANVRGGKGQRSSAQASIEPETGIVAGTLP